MKATRQLFGICALFGAAFGALPGTALGADGPHQRYALISLVGDQLTVVRARRQTGSHVDVNETEVLPTADDALDKIALLAVDNSLRRLDDNPDTTLMSATDHTLFDLSLERQPADWSALMDALKARIRPEVTRLIVVSRYRGDAQLPVMHGHVGTGKLSGLGFYLDELTPMRSSATRERGQGFVAPYAYVTLSLVDTATMTVIKRVVEPVSVLLPTSATAGALTPWEATTPQQKLDRLEAVLRRAVSRGMVELLTAG